MKKFFSAKALAAASVMVALPLVANANSASQEKAHERQRQPLNTQTSNDVQRDSANQSTYKVDVNSGGSQAANEARQRVNEQTKRSTNLDNEDTANSRSRTDSKASQHGRDW